MIRDHRIYICRVEHDHQDRHEDMNGDGHMGPVYRKTDTLIIIANGKQVAAGWLLERFRDKGPKVLSTREMKIDAFVETHTW